MTRHDSYTFSVASLCKRNKLIKHRSRTRIKHEHFFIYSTKKDNEQSLLIQPDSNAIIVHKAYFYLESYFLSSINIFRSCAGNLKALGGYPGIHFYILILVTLIHIFECEYEQDV